MLKFWILFLFIPLSSFAQNIVTGKVVSTANGNSVSDASVFLNNTTTGSKTLTDGSFSLSNIQDGGYKLIVSCVGYETYIQTIIVNKNIHLEDIKLVPKISELGEVQITSKPRPINPLYLKVLTNELLGQTKNARECKILNPRIIHFVYDGTTEKLTATTSKFLIIENKALGYRIKYLLVSFINDPRWGRTTYTGMSLFEQMDSTDAQQLIWKKARAETYRNSTMHFLRACISGDQFDGEHFYVWKVIRTPAENRPTDSVLRERLNKLDDYSNGSAELSKWLKMAKQPPYQQTVDNKTPEINEYIKRTDQKGIYAFGFPYTLMINYDNEGNGSDRNSSFVTFVAPYAYFDVNGILLTPENCIVEGFWGKKRMGELLPDDYKLPGKF
jgi:hypothetical protein